MSPLAAEQKEERLRDKSREVLNRRNAMPPQRALHGNTKTGVLQIHCVSSRLLGPVVPAFRALSGRLKFTVRRHKFNKRFSLLVQVYRMAGPDGSVSGAVVLMYYADRDEVSSPPPNIAGLTLQERLVFYCRTTSASTAPCTSRRTCCPTHCASYCAPCQPLLRAFSGWI